MMPRIEASERLAAISDAAMASGNLPHATASRMTDRLEAAARGEMRRRDRVRATPDVLAAMGIASVNVAAERVRG